jgi:ABC-2 type transport system permease protein
MSAHGTSALSLWRFECATLLRDRAFKGLALLIVGAVAFATMNGIRSAAVQQENVERLRAHESAQLDRARGLAMAIRAGTQPAPRGYWSNPADTRGYAYYLMTAYALKPPAPLAALAVGQSDLLPYQFKLTAGSTAKALAAYELENPRRLRLGTFDLSFAVIYLLPLALIAACYDALASERESGRLSLLVTHGLTPRKLVLTRLALRSLVLFVLLMASALAALAFMGFRFDGPAALRGLLDWTLIALAYTAFWFALIAWVVSWRKPSSGTALALAGVWLALVILVPWATNLATRALHPLPSRADFIRAQRDATDGAVRSQAALRGQFLHDHPELTTIAGGSEAIARFALNQISALEYVEAQVAPVAARFDEQLRRQQALVDRWQWLSPAVLAQQAFNEVTGTSTARHHAFLAQVDTYVTALRAYFNPLMLRGQAEFTGFDEWPRYHWREPEPHEAQRRVRWALIGLLIPAAACSLAGVAALGNTRFSRRFERTFVS